jgi:hypothetical protein
LRNRQLCIYSRENGVGSGKYQPVAGKDQLAASQDALVTRPEELQNEISVIKIGQRGLEEIAAS